VVTKGLRAAALVFAGLLGTGCASAVGSGNRIVVEVKADPDLNSEGGAPQPVMFRAVAMKHSVAPEDLIQWDAARLATVGTLIGGESNWVWPGKTVSLPPLTVKESGEYGFLGITVAYPTPLGKVTPLDAKTREGYEVKSGEHRVTLVLGKNSIKP
jgi:predicted component of type VI protein secretion system